MLHLIFGRAIAKWLEGLGEEPTSLQSPPPTPPVPQIRTNFPPPEPDLTCYDIVPPAPEWVYPVVQRRAMGSLFEIYLAGHDRENLVMAANEALNEVDRLEGRLSHYRDDSDVARLNQNAAEHWVRLEPRLYDLFRRCLEWSDETDGAFDITSGPLAKAWGFFKGDGRIPSDEELAEVMQRVGFYRIARDDDEQMLHFLTPGVEITLGAVGKGYAMDCAAETLKFFGVDRAVIHGGQSSIYALGSPPDSDAWEFTIKDPRDKATLLQTVRLKNESISTSGNYEQFFEQDGVRYSHIIDPMSGRPTQGMISVSVVSSSAAESDALSTAFFVLGRERTLEYCHNHPHLRVIMIEEGPSETIEVTRIGF